METKKELRALCREKRKNIENKEKKSLEIVRRALTLEEVSAADSWFIFYPLENEVNLLPLFEKAKAMEKKIAFPLCNDKDGNMTFHFANSLDELETGYFDLREPKKDLPEAIPENAVIFLPALAIDRRGHRIGYGKGYYDRYLEKYAKLNPFTVGVIFEELLFEEVPHDGHDIPCLKIVFA